MSDGFRLWLEEQNRSRVTIRQYTSTVRRTERWLAAHQHPPLRRADWQAVRAYADSLPLTHASRAALRNAVQAYFRWLGRKPLAPGAFHVPRRPRMRCRAVERWQLEKVLLAAETMGPLQYAAACLAYYTVLRRAEIVRVRWEDIRGDRLHVVGKGLKEDSVLIHPRLLAALTRVPRKDTWLLASPRRSGRHIADGTLNLWFTAIALATGVKVSPHVLRHSGITEALDGTQDLAAVQSFARHEDPRVTAAYSRTGEQRQRAVLAAL